jgi:hypothetical protein
MPAILTETTARFAAALKEHLSRWADEQGLAPLIEHGRRRRSWVLAAEHQHRNVFRPEWWRFIDGRAHRWARALNSSQCFAVNLFGPLADDEAAAGAFVGRMLPDIGLRAGDRVKVHFEWRPDHVPELLGERGQPTQMDAAFVVERAGAWFGVLGVEVKLSEATFGTCRGWTGRRAGAFINAAREGCLDVEKVIAAPTRHCFMARHEGRKYWFEMARADSAVAPGPLRAGQPCPFRHGLYQLMRNHVALDAARRTMGAAWAALGVCVHPLNRDAHVLPEPVGGTDDALDAFRSLLRSPARLRVWNPADVVVEVRACGAGGDDWVAWMRQKYQLPASR